MDQIEIKVYDTATVYLPAGLYTLAKLKRIYEDMEAKQALYAKILSDSLKETKEKK